MGGKAAYSCYARCSIRNPPFRCAICKAALDDRENVIVMSLHTVRRRRSFKRKWILFAEEFPTGDHEIHVHEACMLKGSSPLMLEIYDGCLPDEPKKQRTGHPR